MIDCVGPWEQVKWPVTAIAGEPESEIGHTTFSSEDNMPNLFNRCVSTSRIPFSIFSLSTGTGGD